jgi:predicted metal-binding membrane protein
VKFLRRLLPSPIWLTAIIAGTAIASWAYLLNQQVAVNAGDAMSSMWMPPTGTWAWSAQDFGLVVFMWMVMMAAMMAPAALAIMPMLMRVAMHQNTAHTCGIQVSAFLSGYLGSWLFSALGFSLIQWSLHAMLWLDPMMMPTSTDLTVAIFFGAGVYQFSTLKTVCLAQCRAPLGFLMNHWQPGSQGSLRLGVRYGLFCLGCCFALMLVMLAVGVMNVWWMAVLTAVILAEKLLPLRATVLRLGIGAALIAGALLELLVTS